MEFATWSLQHGVCSMEFATWSLQHGVCNMEYSACSMQYDSECIELDTHGIT